jgi:hypothetical protein
MVVHALCKSLLDAFKKCAKVGKIFPHDEKKVAE